MTFQKKNNRNLTSREAKAVQAARLSGRHTLQAICNSAHCSQTEAIRGMEKSLRYGGAMYHDTDEHGKPRYWLTHPLDNTELLKALTTALNDTPPKRLASAK